MKDWLSRMRYFFTLAFLTSLSLTQLKAQDSTSVGNNGLGFNFLGSPAYGGLTFEGLIENRVAIEGGIGFIGYGGGLSYYYVKPKLNEVAGFAGIKSKYLFSLMHGRKQVITYLPIGASIFGEHVFFSLDIGPAIYNVKSGNIKEQRDPDFKTGKQYGYHGNIKLGLLF